MNKKTFFILSLLTSIYILGNIIWYQINKPIFVLQPESALYFFDVLDSKLFSQIHPPLLPLILKPLFYIFGVANSSIIYMSVNILFFVLSLLFIYKVGERINGAYCGRISMILFSAVPAIYGLSRFYGRQDFHIIPILLMGIYCLIQSDMFKNQKWTILYAISIGLGLLLRETFLGFAIPFFLFYAIWTVFRGINKYQLYNIIIMFIISFVLYSLQFTQTLKFSLLYTPFMEQKQFETLFMKFHIIIGGLSEHILALPLFLLLIFSIIFIFVKKKYKNNLIFMLLCGLILPIIIALVIPHHKQQVYMVPLIPTIILIIATFVSSLKINIRKILLILFITVSLLQYIELSYGYKIWICDTRIKIKNSIIFKYYDKFDEDIIFYDLKKRNMYTNLFKNFEFTKKIKTLILTDRKKDSKFIFQTMRTLLILNKFTNISLNTSVLNLRLPAYKREFRNYKLILDFRTSKAFKNDYYDVMQTILSHKYLVDFKIQTEKEFQEEYDLFWKKYKKTLKYNIYMANLPNCQIYELKKNSED